MINPGSGRVRVQVTLKNAYDNLQRLLDAAGLGDAKWRRDVEESEDDGRFAFLVPINGEDVSILMPGCPLEVLTTERFGTPHLYIDGSSLWFNVAIECLRDRVVSEADGRSR